MRFSYDIVPSSISTCHINTLIEAGNRSKKDEQRFSVFIFLALLLLPTINAFLFVYEPFGLLGRLAFLLFSILLFFTIASVGVGRSLAKSTYDNELIRRFLPEQQRIPKDF